jgi:ABC-type multidrug transport system fused ATPase/permease subunit
MARLPGGVSAWFAHRAALARALRDARPALVSAVVVALVINSLVPAGGAVALAVLVGRVENARPGQVFAAAVPALVLFAVVLLAGHVAEALSQPWEYLAKARIDGAHRRRISELASAAPGIAALESPAVNALIREAKADPETGAEFTPGDGALAQLRWAAAIVGAVAGCVVVASYAWWLIPLLLIPSTINRYIRAKRAFVHNDMWRLCLAEESHADVWRRATVSAGEGKDMRIFGFAEWMIDRMQSHIERGNRPMWRYTLHVVRSEWNQLLLVAVGLVPAFVAAAVSAAHGSTTVAVESAVFAAGWSLYQAFGTSVDLYRMIGAIGVLNASAALREVMAVPRLAAASAVDEPVPDGTPPLVRFEGVSFTYPGTDQPVLRGVDLEIRPGELLALVGLNGAGKSSLIKLLTRLYEPTGGRITVDRRDLNVWDLDRWRSTVAVVFQDFIHYQLAAIDNVTLGQARIPAAPDVAAAAAHDAGFDAVVDKLPQGWDTLLARTRDGGVDLSGGQWQQVALARALYAVRSGATLLVLDEPTAHLDVRSEFEVFQRLSEHRGRTSVVLISHRLSTVRHADRIVLLDGGRIAESGTHQELMAAGGRYAEMFTIQASRFRLGHDDRVEQGELA